MKAERGWEVDYYSMHINHHNFEEDIFAFVRANNIQKLSLSVDALIASIPDQLAAIFAAIPVSVLTLKYQMNNLEIEQEEALSQALRVLPRSISELDLSDNEFGNKSSSALQQIFSAIPQSVVMLALANNQFFSETEQEILAHSLQLLPHSIRSLDLSWNGLGFKSGEALSELLSSIPHNVVSLNLAGNHLGDADITLICSALSFLSTTVSSLDLSANQLYMKTEEQLSEMFEAIPESVTSLKLSNNFFGKVGGNALSAALCALHSYLTVLDLSDNSLNEKESSELGQIFTKIPDSVTSLNLEKNQLGKMNLEHLEWVFFCIPRNLYELKLGENELYLKKGPELAKLFHSLPTITILDLKENRLATRPHVRISRYGDSDQNVDPILRDILTIMFRIPKSVVSLDLSGNDFGRMMTEKGLAIMFEHLPSTLKSLDLGFNELQNLTADQLKTAFSVFNKDLTLSLHGNNLFYKCQNFHRVDRVHASRDRLLQALSRPSLKCNVDLSFNGESDFQRALCPMVSLPRKLRLKNFSHDLVAYILSFLTQQSFSLALIAEAVNELSSTIADRPNNNTPVWQGARPLIFAGHNQEQVNNTDPNNRLTGAI